MKVYLRRKLARAVVILLVASAVYFFMIVGEILSEQGTNVIASNAVFVLGGDRWERIDEAVKLYHSKKAEMIVLMGYNEDLWSIHEKYTSWRPEWLKKQRVILGDVIYEHNSTSSWDEGWNVRFLVNAYKWNNILIISDPPHMRRLSYVYRKIMAGSNCSYAIVSTDPAWWDDSRWWKNGTAAKCGIKEIGKNFIYRIVYHFE